MRLCCSDSAIYSKKCWKQFLRAALAQHKMEFTWCSTCVILSWLVCFPEGEGAKQPCKVVMKFQDTFSWKVHGDQDCCWPVNTLDFKICTALLSWSCLKIQMQMTESFIYTAFQFYSPKTSLIALNILKGAVTSWQRKWLYQLRDF